MTSDAPRRRNRRRSSRPTTPTTTASIASPETPLPELAPIAETVLQEPSPTAVEPSSPPDRPPRPPRQSRQERRERRQEAARTRRLSETAGPDPATPISDVRLVVGRVVGTHGINGELKVLLSTDEPEHLITLKRIYLGEESTPRRVLSARLHDRYALMRLKGITTPEAGMELRGLLVKIAGSDARPPSEGEFYLYQLMGLTAIDEAGETIGTVTDIMETGANDVFVVSPPGGGSDILIPNHPSVVLDINPNEGRMTIRPLVYDS